jgi:hypothetical protein
LTTTLKIQSFSESNIRERTALTASVAAGESSLPVESTQGYAPGDIIYLGALSRDECEKAVVQAVPSATVLTLASPLTLDHNRLDAVTSVLGDLIHIYRAPDVDGQVPADEMFTVLATRNIDPDQQSSYYTDSSGSSAFWYRSTYFNATTMEETRLGDSQPVRGDDFGHYATLGAIRAEAGLKNALNLNDLDVDRQRRNAENEVNSALTGVYEIPFKKVPSLITTIVEKLAAGFLMNDEFPDSKMGDPKIKDARAALDRYKTGANQIDPEDGGVDVQGTAVSGWPDDTTEGERAFTMGDVY